MTRGLVALLPRMPVPVLGLLLVSYSVLTACTGMVDGIEPEPPNLLGDAGAPDAPSEDSDADRADGMSYGDAYGDLDAGAPDGGSGGSCVTSPVAYPPAPGCPAGDHMWACWAPTSATAGIPDSSYTVLTLCGDGVVIDRNTHLMWAQQEEPGTYGYAAAAAECKSSRRAGFSDWRLPSSNELMSLVDYSRSVTPVFDPDVFGYHGASNAATWSNTPFAQQAGQAWQLYGSGGVYPQDVSVAGQVRCVR